MARRYDTVSFLTDYGLVDEFVGVVKSVIRDLAPHVGVIDITHSVPPFDIAAGALTLARSMSYLASGVVLAVVDPGVATDRRAVAIEVADGEGVLVGPDNGLLAPAVAMAGGAGRCVVLTNTEYQLEAPGGTFAGRDIFAPAAAYLCNGVDLFELGDPIDASELIPGVVPLPRTEGSVLVGEVLWVDRFGNCQLNVGPDEADGLGDTLRVTIGDPSQGGVVRVARRAESFAGLGPGVLGLVTDSYGMLALALDQRSAAAELGIAAHEQVVLEGIPDEAADEQVDQGPVTSPVNLRIRR